MKLLDNKIPQVDFEKIHALITSGISTIKEENIQVNGYGAISGNDGAWNNVYIVHNKSVSYTI